MNRRSTNDTLYIESVELTLIFCSKYLVQVIVYINIYVRHFCTAGFLNTLELALVWFYIPDVAINTWWILLSSNPVPRSERKNFGRCGYKNFDSFAFKIGAIFSSKCSWPWWISLWILSRGMLDFLAYPTTSEFETLHQWSITAIHNQLTWELNLYRIYLHTIHSLCRVWNNGNFSRWKGRGSTNETWYC